MAGPIRNMLVYVDGTEESVIASQYAIMLAQSSGAQLRAAYVVNTRAINDLVRARIFVESEQLEYQRDVEADADRYLEHVKQLGRQKGAAIETIKCSGDAYREIKRLVKEHNIDLLILGEIAHARSRRDEFFSDADRVMRAVPCSVLVVKDDDRVWTMFESGAY